MGRLLQDIPIPKRIPPLTWRQPVLIWTPVALTLALGWPALILRNDAGLAQTALIGGAMVFALSFISMGAAWIMKRAPRTRRDVIMHFVGAGALVSVAAPFVIMSLLNTVAEAEQASTGLRAATPYALTPLALVLGLPIAFFHGLVFSFVALVKRPQALPPDQGGRALTRRARQDMREVQPFA
ncbi:MAG: hypothetical protein AB7P07_01590 [Hyphomonadaceae bacterium]